MERKYQSNNAQFQRITLGKILYYFSPPRHSTDMDALKALLSEDSFFPREIRQEEVPRGTFIPLINIDRHPPDQNDG